MNIPTGGIQSIRVFMQSMGLFLIWMTIKTHACATENTASNLYLETSLQLSTLSKKQNSSEKIKVSFSKSSYFLISAPDNFSPGSKLTPSISNTKPEYSNHSIHLLGWPLLDEKKQREQEAQLKKILEKKLYEQEKTTQKENDLKEKLEKKLKKILDHTREREEKEKSKREKLEIRRIKKKEKQDLKNQEQHQKELEKERKEESKKQKKISRQNKDKKSLIKTKSTKARFNRVSNNSGQINQTIESTTTFELFNKDNINFTTGFNTYQQRDVEPIQNIPIKLEWEHKIRDFTVSVNTGIEWFDKVPISPSFKANAKISIKIPKKIGKSLLVSGEIDYGPYKFNAKTIQNQINYYRLRGSLFWQINKKTSLFSLNYIGGLNDGNTEFQTFNRLERQIGDFTIAGNLFFWGFQKDMSQASGYFSPPDFLVYNLELDWKGKISKYLSCRLAISLGQQQAQGKISNSTTFQSLCTAKITKNIDFDFGYGVSNSFTGANIGNSGSALTNTWTGELRVKF